jgi:hypothetical protein
MTPVRVADQEVGRAAALQVVLAPLVLTRWRRRRVL